MEEHEECSGMIAREVLFVTPRPEKVYSICNCRGV